MHILFVVPAVCSMPAEDFVADALLSTHNAGHAAVICSTFAVTLIGHGLLSTCNAGHA